MSVRSQKGVVGVSTRKWIHPRIVGIWLFFFTAENIVYCSAITLDLFTLLRDSRQVDPAAFLQSRQRRVPELPSHRGQRW